MNEDVESLSRFSLRAFNLFFARYAQLRKPTATEIASFSSSFNKSFFNKRSKTSSAFLYSIKLMFGEIVF